MFVNFAKKQSDNLEQQETEPPSALQSPLGRLLSLFRPRSAPTELRALVTDEPEDLDTEDEGLIRFEEERVSRAHRPGSPAVGRRGGVAAGTLAEEDREIRLMLRARMDVGTAGTGREDRPATDPSVRGSSAGPQIGRAEVARGHESPKHSDHQAGQRGHTPLQSVGAGARGRDHV